MKTEQETKMAMEDAPTAKSKNKKSVGPTLTSSPGTEQTEAGMEQDRDKSSHDITPRAAGEKKGTVHRSSKESRGERPAGIDRSKQPEEMPSANSDEKPVSKSKGKNSAAGSSRPFGQP